MRKSLLIIAIIGVMLCVTGAILFANASTPASPAVNSAAAQLNVQPSLSVTGDSMTPSNCTFPGNFTFLGNMTFPGNFGFQGNRGFQGRMMQGMRGPQMNGQQLSEGFLQNATVASVSGTVVTETRGLLLLDTTSGQVSIQIPNEWNIGSQVIGGYALFNGTFASSGQTITIQVLESNIFSNTNFNLNEMVGYQATNSTGTIATAVLPFNITPAS